MKYKELEKRVEELHFLAGKLYSKFCKGELCTNCKLDINSDCILHKLIMTIDALEEKQV